MTVEHVMSMTTFKRTKKGVRLVDDRNGMVAEWRDGCVNPPTTHQEAAEQAIELMRERGMIR